MTIMGTVYKAEKCWLMISTTEIPIGTVPKFGLLYDIIIQGSDLEPNTYFFFIVIDTLNYGPVSGAKQLQQYQCFYRSAISNCCYHPLNAVQHGPGNLYIKSKYDLSVVVTEYIC